MAYAEPTLSRLSSILSLANLWAGVAERLTQRRAYRATVEELAALSDRELADIGVHRSDIRAFARTTARAV